MADAPGGRLTVGLLILCAGCLHRSPAPPPPEPLPPEITGAISPFKNFDRRPYELIWANREEDEEPLVDFEGMMGWTTEVTGPATAEFIRTDEVQLWDLYVGKLVLSGAAAGSRIRLKPPAPLLIRDRFNSASFWLCGDTNRTVGLSRAAATEVRLELAGESGEPVEVPLAGLDWQGWWMVHIKIDTNTQARLIYPCYLTGIDFLPGAPVSRESIYMDSLCLYTERQPPLELEPRPGRNLDLYPGQSPGLHTGTERLPFPTRPETVLPTNEISRYRQGMVAESNNIYSLFYKGEDGELIYRIDPSNRIHGVEARWNGRVIGNFLDQAGLEGLSAGASELVVLRQEGDAVRAMFNDGLTCDFHILQKTLILDVVRRGGQAAGLSLGRCTGLRNPRLLSVPMLGVGPGTAPAVAMLDVDDPATNQTLFATVWLDPYRSNASEWYFDQRVEKDAVVIDGGVRYRPTTEGRRNDLFERILVTVSPRLEEVLPAVPNPPGFHARMAGERVWADTASPLNYEEERHRSRTLRRYGLDKVIQCTSREVWQDENESYTLRTQPAPRRGGDAQLKSFIQAQRELGWYEGLYANYYDLSPLSARWSPDYVQRLESGEWRRGDPANYVLVAPRAVELEAKIAARLRSQFFSNASFLDVQTAIPPWAATDYDARVPGAGTFAQTLYCYGELMRQESDICGGPLVGAEGYQWLYAGLTDAHLGAARHPGMRARQPYLPVFLLEKIQPLECRYGMGAFSEFFQDSPRRADDADGALSEYLAAEIAYGCNGRLADSGLGLRRVCRSYYLLQQLQLRYNLRAPERIGYWDGERMLDSSEAITSGALKWSQIYVHYPGDLEVWVNGSPDLSWKVRLGRDTWDLPPFGWLASAPGFLEVSAQDGGRRIDYVQSPAYTYFDGGGQWEPFRNMACASSLVVRELESDSGRRFEVIDPGGVGRFGFRPEGAMPTVRGAAFDLDGKSAGKLRIKSEDTLDWFTGPPLAVRYVIDYSEE